MGTPAFPSVKNSMLSGGWAPVFEELDAPCVDVIGTIPTDLDGYFFRNGPNPMFQPMEPEKYHFFDGDGMIHQVEIRDGKAHYRNRWVDTRCLQIEKEHGKGLWRGFRSPPDFGNQFGIPMKHPANTHIVYHNGKLLALWEAGLPYEMTFPDMKTVGELDFDGEWRHAFTAHPTIDPRNGDLVTFYYSILAKPHLKYGVINKDGKVVHRTGIDLPKPVMIHDIAITDSYSVIAVTPYVFSLERAMAGEYPFAWEPELGTRIGVIPRYADGSQIKWFDVENGHIQHIFNAYEEGDEVVYDVCRSRQTSLATSTSFDPDLEHAQPYRYRFNMKTGEHTEGVVNDIFVEFSRINENYTGIKNRYGYASRFVKQIAPRFDALVKIDNETGLVDIYEPGPKISVGEFVFAPRVNAKDEDDGYCLAIVRENEGSSCQLLIIDAKHISAGPVATVRLPARVPDGFHANWVPRPAVI